MRSRRIGCLQPPAWKSALMSITPVLRARDRTFADVTRRTPRPSRDTQTPHTGRTRAAQRPTCACGPYVAPHPSGYRGWPGWMLFCPFRFRFPDQSTHSSSGRGQENSSSTEQHPARQEQRSRSRARSQPTVVPHRPMTGETASKTTHMTRRRRDRGSSTAPRPGTGTHHGRRKVHRPQAQGRPGDGDRVSQTLRNGTGVRIYFLRLTKDPQPGVTSMRPSSASTASACRAVLRAIPYSCISVVIDGTRSPGPSSPDSIRARSSLAT